MRLAPEIPLGARLQSASVCGHSAAVRLETHNQDEHAVLDFVVPRGDCEMIIKYSDGVVISMPPVRPSIGNQSTSAFLTSLQLNPSSLLLDLDVIPSVENKIWIRTQRPVSSAASANLQKINQNLYELNIPVRKDSSAYKHLQIAVEFAR
jgi:hypothetical protein